jgi:hypothetical protein
MIRPAAQYRLALLRARLDEEKRALMFPPAPAHMDNNQMAGFLRRENAR